MIFVFLCWYVLRGFLAVRFDDFCESAWGLMEARCMLVGGSVQEVAKWVLLFKFDH